MEGIKVSYNPDQEEIVQLQMYGFIKNENNCIKVSNRIFEMRLYNLFLSEEELKDNVFSREGSYDRNIFVESGHLNMEMVLDHFAMAYSEIMGSQAERFKEKDGRELFLLYLKPIINGTGNYYIEAQTRDQRRTDVIVDYLGERYVIELKIWRGNKYNSDGEQQLIDYLNAYHLDTGYMLIFSFNQDKKSGTVKKVVDGKTIYETIV